MANTLPTNIGEKFAENTLRKFYGKAVALEISNQEYEPMASKGGTDRVHLMSFLNSVTLSDYTGADISIESWLGDNEDTLLLDQKKAFNVKIDDLNAFEAYVNDLSSYVIEDAAGILQQTIDSYVLQTASNNVKVGHCIGSDWIRGSCYVSAAGAIVASQVESNGGIFDNSTNNRALVGSGVSFDGGTTWYRISAWTSSIAVTITDWNGSTYSGGAKVDQTSVKVEAIQPLTLTSTTVYGKIVDMRTALAKDDIPVDNLWLVISPDIGGILRQSSDLTPAVPVAYEKVVENGLLGYIAGFRVYESTRVRGNNSSGFYCVAGHKKFITFAHTFKESRVVESENSFSKKYQGLNVYGAIVPTERRKAGAMLFCKK